MTTTQERVITAVQADAFGFILGARKSGAPYNVATLRWANGDSAVVNVQARMADVKIVAVTFSWSPRSTTMLRGTDAMLARSISEAVRSHNHGHPTLFTSAETPNGSFVCSNLTEQNGRPLF